MVIFTEEKSCLALAKFPFVSGLVHEGKLLSPLCVNNETTRATTTTTTQLLVFNQISFVASHPGGS